MADGDDLSDLTSLPDEILRDWVQEAGLEPPLVTSPLSPSRRDKHKRFHPPRKWAWARWWHAGCQKMTEAQRVQVYRGLDKINFLEVIELELEE